MEGAVILIFNRVLSLSSVRLLSLGMSLNSK